MVRSTTLLVVPLLLNGVGAFAPSSSIQRYQCSPTKMNSSPAAPLEAAPLEVVNEEDGSAASSDPFDTYTATKDQKSIATRDLSVGSGYTVGSDDAQLLKISFTSKFVESKFTANIKEFDTNDMVFKTGEQRCLPGLEEGLKGMKVGGTRLVKVPPNKGYGNNWYRGVVPPNSHLEFKVTVDKIAQSPIEEFQMKLEQFGYDRAIGSSLCLGYMAFAPMLHEKGILPF